MSVYSSHLQTNAKEIYVGTINFDESYLNEVNIGSISLSNKLGNCAIYVYTRDEGKHVPHFHIVSTKENVHDCCIKIFEPDYFPHGIHDKKLDNAKQKTILDTYLRQPYKNNKNITNWDFIVESWPYREASLYVKQPDYTKLP